MLVQIGGPAGHDGRRGRHRLVLGLVLTGQCRTARRRSRVRAARLATDAAGGHGKAAADMARPRKAKASRGTSPNPLVLNLPPITTNLAAPSDTWLRLELSVELDAAERGPDAGRHHPAGPARLLRTVKLHQIEGASGFQHLKADLDRARRDPQRRPRQGSSSSGPCSSNERSSPQRSLLLPARARRRRSPSRSTSAPSARPTARPSATSSRCSGCSRSCPSRRAC